MPRLTDKTWMQVRTVFETRRDITFAKLGKMYGVSPAMVGRRAKAQKWSRASAESIGSLADTSIAKPCNGSANGKRSPEMLQELVTVLAITGSKKHACNHVGISVNTLKQWCEEEPKLLNQIEVARAKQLTKHFNVIADSRDWKAHKEILARSPETKEQWGDIQEKGPTIILNIHRDEVIIPVDPVEPEKPALSKPQAVE